MRKVNDSKGNEIFTGSLFHLHQHTATIKQHLCNWRKYISCYFMSALQPLGNPSTPSKSRSNYLHPVNLLYCIECSPCLAWRNQTQIGWLLCRSLLSFLEGRLWASVFYEKSSTCNVDVVFSISSNADWPVHHYSIFYYFKFPATQVLDLTRSALIFFFPLHCPHFSFIYTSSTYSVAINKLSPFSLILHYHHLLYSTSLSFTLSRTSRYSYYLYTLWPT